MKKKDLKKILSVVKIIIALLIAFYLFNSVDKNKILEIFKNANINYISSALLLLILNLFIQFKKWQYLVRTVNKETSSHEILGSVFIGITLGFITPGKIGEIGKLFFIANTDRLKLLGLSIFEKLYDTYPVIIFGLISLPFLPGVFFNNFLVVHTNGFIFSLLAIFIILFTALNPGLIQAVLQYLDNRIFHKNKKFEKAIYAIENFEKKNAKTLLFYAVALFLTYSTQLVLLIHSLFPVSISDSYIAVWSSIVIKTALPISFGDIGIREGATAFAFNFFDYPKEAAISAAFMLFIINIIIPSIIGIFLIPFLKFISKNKLFRITH